MTEKDTPLPPSGGSWIHDPVTGTLSRAVAELPKALIAEAETDPVLAEMPVAQTKEKSK